MTGEGASAGQALTVSVDDRSDDSTRRTVLSLTGELDVVTVPTLQQTVDRVLVDGTAVVAIDLSGLTFMDSSGLGSLVAAHKKARALKSELVLVRPTRLLHRLFSTTGLTQVFRFSESVDEALASPPA